MSTDDNLDILDATLCFVAMYGIPVPDKEYDVFCKGFMHTKGYKEAKASIKAESLRIALEIIEHTELRDVYSKADSTEKAIPQLKVNYRNQFRQAFEDRYSK